MLNSKICITHEMEGILASYCATNNIEITLANAYDIFMEAFKDEEVLIGKYNEETDKLDTIDGKVKTAQYFEHQEKTIFRVNEKSKIVKKSLEQETYKNNIKLAEDVSVPNLIDLVENLHKLNIVDAESYLAFICFLMQLKYSRNHVFQEDDKTCVFFNGVARNGKSATAKAILEVESKYGQIYRATTGKILESTHEEEVWKSHLNFFDEVKPSDVDRELLLTIINGGNVELNPKNKPQYTYFVNTNNIFTSNDQIHLKQRRVSVIKFGDRLNGRPLGQDSLKNIITNIMNSLPSFEHYYDIYTEVSSNNELRINSLAIEAVLSYFNNLYPPINSKGDDVIYNMNYSRIFSAHNIYDNFKNHYNKQIIPTEKREAIKDFLNSLEKNGLITLSNDYNCSTKFYEILYKNYLQIVDEYNKYNTKDEKNIKITKLELCSYLKKYFQDIQVDSNDSDETDINSNDLVDNFYNDLIEKKQNQNISISTVISDINMVKMKLSDVRDLIKRNEVNGEEISIKKLIDDVYFDFLGYITIPYYILLALMKEYSIPLTAEDADYLKDKYNNYMQHMNKVEYEIQEGTNKILGKDSKIINIFKPEDKVIGSIDIDLYEDQSKVYFKFEQDLNNLKLHYGYSADLDYYINESSSFEKICKKLSFNNIKEGFARVFKDKYNKKLINKLKKRYEEIIVKKAKIASKND